MSSEEEVVVVFLTWKGGAGLFHTRLKSTERHNHLKGIGSHEGQILCGVIEIRERGEDGDWIALHEEVVLASSMDTLLDGVGEMRARFDKWEPARKLGRYAVTIDGTLDGEFLPDSEASERAKRALFKNYFPRTFGIMEAPRRSVDGGAEKFEKEVAVFEIERMRFHRRFKPNEGGEFKIPPGRDDLYRIVSRISQQIADGDDGSEKRYLFALALRWDEFQEEGLSWDERALRIGGMVDGVDGVDGAIKTTTLKSGAEKLGLFTGASPGQKQKPKPKPS